MVRFVFPGSRTPKPFSLSFLMNGDAPLIPASTDNSPLMPSEYSSTQVAAR